MTSFRVYGDKLVHYYTDINASDDIDALLQARTVPTHDWFPIERDTTIEPYEAELIKDNIVQGELDISDI